jgi:hypothetical protein
VRNIISDNRLRQPCSKPEDILNASIQVIVGMTFGVLMVSGHRHCTAFAAFVFWKVQYKSNVMEIRSDYAYGQLCRYVQGSPVAMKTPTCRSLVG